MHKWEIWCVRQKDLQAVSEESVTCDAVRETRYYVILSPNDWLKSGGSVMYSPIKSNEGNKKYCLPIKPNSTNNLNPAQMSYLYCHQVYTSDQNKFKTNAVWCGVLDEHLRPYALANLLKFVQLP